MCNVVSNSSDKTESVNAFPNSLPSQLVSISSSRTHTSPNPINIIKTMDNKPNDTKDGTFDMMQFILKHHLLPKVLNSNATAGKTRHILNTEYNKSPRLSC